MGNASSDDGDEQNAHRVLVIRTKDSAGQKLIGASECGGYYHNKKYVTWDDTYAQPVTMALSLWDTPPIDWSGSVHQVLTAPAYKYAHGLLCVYSVESAESFHLICHQISHVYKNPQKTPFRDVSKIVILLIGHKTKLFRESMRRVPEHVANEFANAMDITFLEVSSSDWRDLSDCFTIVGKELYSIHGELPLVSRQHMTEVTELLDINVDVSQIDIADHMSTPKLKPKVSPVSEAEEKVNDVASENDSLSDLSDYEEHSQRQQHAKASVSVHDGNRESEEESPTSSAESIYARKFRQFLVERVQLPAAVYDLFARKGYNDVRMISDFDDALLCNEIGIENQIHRKLILRQCEQYALEMQQFDNWLKHRVQLGRYKLKFENNGILTMYDLVRHIQCMQDFDRLLAIDCKPHQHKLWNAVQEYESANHDSDFYPSTSPFAFEFDGDDKSCASLNASPSTTPRNPYMPRSAFKPKVSVKTKMDDAYRNIQRNKEIFNCIKKNHEYKELTHQRRIGSNGVLPSQSVRDLESIMKPVQLSAPHTPNKFKRSSSASSEPSTAAKYGFSTPRGMSPKWSDISKKMMPRKPVPKRRKSFSMGGVSQ